MSAEMFSYGLLILCGFGLWIISKALYDAWKDSRDE
jgi:hypothetical protein